MLDESLGWTNHAKFGVSDVFEFHSLLRKGEDLSSPAIKKSFTPKTYESLSCPNFFSSTNNNQVYPVYAATTSMTPWDNSLLRCMYTNATSLNSCKLNELTIISKSESPHIILITETWWKPTSIVNLPNYNVHRKDRLNKGGGGVAIYTHNSLNVCEIELISNTTSEQIWVQLLTANEKILFGCMYRPPELKSDTDIQILNTFNRVKN